MSTSAPADWAQRDERRPRGSGWVGANTGSACRSGGSEVQPDSEECCREGRGGMKAEFKDREPWAATSRGPRRAELAARRALLVTRELHSSFESVPSLTLLRTILGGTSARHSVEASAGGLLEAVERVGGPRRWRERAASISQPSLFSTLGPAWSPFPIPLPLGRGQSVPSIEAAVSGCEASSSVLRMRVHYSKV